MSYTGPMPSITQESEGFFAAAKRSVFALHRCRLCGTWYWPASACRSCRNEPFMSNMSWEPASGRATLFSYTVPRRTFHPAFPAPFVYGLVKTEEGPLIPCGVDVDPDTARIGLPLEVYFVDLSPEYAVPRFKPLSQR